MDMLSFSSAYRSLRKDLKLKHYKITVKPLLNDEHKAQKKKFASWARKEFWTEDTMKILFSDEKMFDLDSIHNSENDRIWALIRRKQIGEMERTATKVSTKSDGMVSCMLRER